uniref:(northern house mosquito) hypothetical protein n=1 Tax=Culex pipiens TaxID=7175 RepID=A0A8D8IVY8_CULPI
MLQAACSRALSSGKSRSESLESITLTVVVASTLFRLCFRVERECLRGSCLRFSRTRDGGRLAGSRDTARYRLDVGRRDFNESAVRELRGFRRAGRGFGLGTGSYRNRSKSSSSSSEMHS